MNRRASRASVIVGACLIQAALLVGWSIETGAADRTDAGGVPAPYGAQPPQEAAGHGEMAFYPPRLLVRSHALAAIREITKQGRDFGPRARGIVTRLAQAEKELEAFDNFNDLARRALLGDQKALEAARGWLAEAASRPRHPAEPDTPAGTNMLRADSLLHPSALLDLYVGAALLAPADMRRSTLEAIHRRVLTATRPVAGTISTFDELPGNRSLRDRARLVLDRLGDRGLDRFDRMPLDLGGCLGELLNVLGQPAGAVGRGSEAVRQEIDDNSGRIGSVAPIPVCTGQPLTLNATAGQSFVQRRDVSVVFSPCGLLATDLKWGRSAVTAVVPLNARTGPVYFANTDRSGDPGLTESRIAEIGNVLNGCPFLGAGASTSLMAGLMRGPLNGARCVLPVGVGRAATIIGSPEITVLRAVNENGSPFGAQSWPSANDAITVEWEVQVDPAAKATLRLLADGTALAQGLPFRGSRAIPPPQVARTYTLEVTGTCGTASRRIAVNVQPTLTFDPPDRSIMPGQNATLTLRVDRPASTATTILLTTTPSQSGAPSSVQIPAGQLQASITYTGLQSGPPGGPTLTVLAYAQGYASATGRIWVAVPQGVVRIVADERGTQGRAAIDVVGVHAALLPTGSVLLFAYDESAKAYDEINVGKSAVWNPATNQVTSIPMGRNLFCAGECFLGDGRLLVTGGQSTAITLEGTFASRFGSGRGADHDLHLFSGGRWTRVLPDMPGARWYPTCTTLPDGRALILSGYAAHAYWAINGDYEIFDGSSNTVARRQSFTNLIPFNHEFDVYPAVQILPGRNLFVHNHDTTWLLSLDSSNAPTMPGLGFTPFYNARSPNSRSYPTAGAAVMLPLDPDAPTKASILVLGGGGAMHGGVSASTPATNTAEIFEYDSTRALNTQAGWRFTRDRMTGNQTFLTNRRLMADAVLLPDKSVAIIGGSDGGAADDTRPPIMPVMFIESFDPVTETFSRRTTISVPRLYHSTALLLPDGSVLMAGSTGDHWSYKIDGGSNNEFQLEIYYPPYLFRGPRPTLRLPSTALKHGQQLAIEIPSGPSVIQSVALIRHGSTTHTNNMDQRYVGLKIASRTATHLNVMLPPNTAVAPPGPYLLFVVAADANGDPVPSIGALTTLTP